MNKFRTEYSLIVLFPFVASIIGAILAGMPISSRGLGAVQITLAAGLITGLIALFYRYIQGLYQWYLIIGLPIILALVMSIGMRGNFSIFALVLPNLTFFLATFGIVKYLFYTKLLIRLRTLIIGLSGALLLTGYLAAINQLVIGDLHSGLVNAALFQGWNATFLNSLIIYVFIAFGMSVADLIILQIDVKRMKNEVNTQDD